MPFPRHWVWSLRSPSARLRTSSAPAPAIRHALCITITATEIATASRWHYYGDGDCHRVALAPGRGAKACAYGCTGLGSCARACPFDAISVVDGCARVDAEACRGCGVCVATCPHHLIELIPANASVAVRCASREKGKTVRDMCDAGCIGCGLCARICPTGAVTVVGNLSHVDQTACIGCGKCAEKCPAKVIERLK